MMAAVARSRIRDRLFQGNQATLFLLINGNKNIDPVLHGKRHYRYLCCTGTG